MLVHTHTPHPVTPQYDPQFGDAFYNSSKYGMMTYLLRMMTSWAIVCSVWYLPPMTRQVGAQPMPGAPVLCAPHPARGLAHVLSCRRRRTRSSLPTG